MKSVSKATSVALVSMLLSSACAPHVALPNVLPRDAPLEMRRAQYEQFRPVNTETIVTSGGFMTSGGYRSTGPTMSTRTTLANGTPVYYSEDLFPLVGPNSDSWRHTETARTLESTSTWTTVAAFPLAGLGVTFLFLGTTTFRWSSDTTLGVSIPLLVVAGLSSITGGVTRYIAGWQRRDAFLAFDGDFRNNLGLCLTGAGLGDCAPSPLPINGAPAIPPPPPTAALASPMLRF